MERMATVTEIWKFFGKTENCTSLADFRNEWAQLSDEEKEFFKKEVGAVI